MLKKTILKSLKNKNTAETEDNIDSTKEASSNISETKVHIGKNILQNIAKNKTEEFNHDEEYEDFFDCKETSPNINLLIDNTEKNDYKISEKQNYSKQSQEADYYVDPEKAIEEVKMTRENFSSTMERLFGDQLREGLYE